MKNKYILLLFVLILLVPGVFADGACQLDKYEYHPGESGLFSCSCSSAAEENRNGFIVWQNSTTILQAVAVNSNACRSDFFTGSYTFLTGVNYSGNVTFSASADGTGSPASWGNAGDVRDDTWNVSGPHVTDCIIYDVTANLPDVGTTAVVKFHVRDGVTGNDLSNVRCGISIYDTTDLPLFVHRENGHHFERSLTTGEVYFSHLLSEPEWVSGQSLIGEFHCACYGNVNDTENLCYDETTGLSVGSKFCTLKSPLVLGSGDYRNQGNILGIVVGLFIVMLIYGVVGYFCLKYSGVNEDNTAFWFAIFCFGIVISELIFLTGVLYINELGWNLAGLLNMHWLIMLLLSLGIGFGSLILITMRIFRWKAEDKKEEKW